MRDKGCYVRAAPGLFGVFDAGLQLIGNRFLKSPDTFEAAYPLRVMQCVACEMLQMREPFPAEELLPAYDWVTYIELEDHLDELAETMCALPGIGPEPVVAGVSFKDYTTLDRLTRLCVKHRWRLDLREHLLLDWVNGGHGAETLQAHLTEDAAWCIAARRGAADILLVRHVAEHAYDPDEFLRAFTALIKPGGWVVIEVPDSQRALGAGDCTTLWEEHTLYYTAATFQQSPRIVGLESVFFGNYVYPFENSLVAILKVAPPGRADAAVNAEEWARGTGFGSRLAPRRAAFWKNSRELSPDQGRVAMFGAGHLAATFLKVMNAPGLIYFVIDDNPNKRGLFKPGSRMPLVGSPAPLDSTNVKLCLLGLNLLVEKEVMYRQAAFTARRVQVNLPVQRGCAGALMRARKVRPEVFYPDELVDRDDVTSLVTEADPIPCRRTRRSANDRLHEMLIMHHREAYIRAHRHLGRAEWMHIIEGETDLVLFDKAGVLTEVTSGPLRREESEFAPWALADDDAAAVQAFLASTERQLRTMIGSSLL